MGNVPLHMSVPDESACTLHQLTSGHNRYNVLTNTIVLNEFLPRQVAL